MSHTEKETKEEKDPVVGRVVGREKHGTESGSRSRVAD